MINKNRPIMILGCTSDAGKSLVVTAICRLLSNRGIKVAPFKAQNMSNNAAITEDGLEMGRAQYLQALAARVKPSVLMNPVLLKPSADTYSQVIVNGLLNNKIASLPWSKRKDLLWPEVQKSLTKLQSEYQQVVIEGAGSPAEINLRAGDIVNMSVALECQADVYLIADIDKGGAFAHLLGTWFCLSKDEQKLIKGFVLNKFRGDAALLGNAMSWLEEKTGVPTVANIPYYRHHLPEEDSFRLGEKWQRGKINIALIYYPYASNLDEFDPLIYQDDVNLVPVHQYIDLTLFDALILPGSKNSGASLDFLQSSGLAEQICLFKNTGKLILGICGGLQILGAEISDPLKIEGGDKKGLALIDLKTEISANKSTKQTRVNCFNGVINGYEIHHGKTISSTGLDPFMCQGLGWKTENICTTYLHGCFENRVFYNWFMKQVGGLQNGLDWSVYTDNELNRLAEMFEKHGWL